MNCNLYSKRGKATASSHNKTAWLEVDGLSIFFDNLESARLAAAAINCDEGEMRALLEEPDMPTYDEALGAKCDAEERLARDLRDAGRGHLVKP